MKARLFSEQLSMRRRPTMRDDRTYLCVAGFDELQSPKRPKRPSWIKSRVDDLDSIEYMQLSLSARGFLSDFTKLAATLQNRVPCDFSFIAQRLCSRPTTVAQHVRNTIAAGFLLEFNLSQNAKETTTCEENGNPSGNLLSSSSNSPSSLQGGTYPTTTTAPSDSSTETCKSSAAVSCVVDRSIDLSCRSERSAEPDADYSEWAELAEAREVERDDLAHAIAATGRVVV